MLSKKFQEKVFSHTLQLLNANILWDRIIKNRGKINIQIKFCEIISFYKKKNFLKFSKLKKNFNQYIQTYL